MSLHLFSESFANFARIAAPIAVAGLWQGLAVFAGLALCLKVAPRIAAAQRFILWAAAFATLAALPLAGLALNSIRNSARGSDLSAASPHAWLQLDARWTFVVAGLWLAASLIRATDLAISSLRLRRLWRTAAPVDFPTSSHTTRAFEVCSTKFLDRPSVIGFSAPRILIPDWLLPRLTPGELNQIVLHEATHLGRRDDWTNLFQKLCLVLFPLNPALWGIERRLAKEREMACDEAVVRITQAPRAYAACLASLAERGLERRKEALSLGAWQHRSELVHRVQSILHRNRLMHPIAARVLLGALACGLFGVTAELARCPQLIAFAPSEPVQNFAQSSQLGDAAYPVNARPAKLPAGFRAVQARAEMQSTPVVNNAGNRARTNLKTAAVGELRASSEPATSTSRLPAQRPVSVSQPVLAGQPANRLQSSEQQWIVFTAWEQVETTGTPAKAPAPKGTSFAEKTGTTADYDTGTSSADASGDPDSKATTTSRMRVTQLIFKVVPAGARSSHATAIPIGDGWLVIQL